MSGTSSIPGTNVPPVSFPGIASGIDYNSIITKLTSLSLQPTVSLNAQISTLNAGNAELIKINSMLASVQNALTALSQSEFYNAVDAASSDPLQPPETAVLQLPVGLVPLPMMKLFWFSW